MAPTQFTYFDYYQWPWPALSLARSAGSCHSKRFTASIPIPPDLSAESAKHVLGAQSQLWSEWIPQRQEMEYMAFPRLCALAEVVWSPQAARNFADFSNRLASGHGAAESARRSFSTGNTAACSVAHWEANPAPSANAGASTPPAMPPPQAATPPAANVTPSAARAATQALTPVTPAPAPLPPGPFAEREWDVSNSVRTPGTYIAAFIQTQGGGQARNRMGRTPRKRKPGCTDHTSRFYGHAI